MGRGHFTMEEIEALLRNPNVLNANERSISYSPVFKLRFMEEYLNGKRPVQIFREAGFDIKMLGSKRIERACARWKESYQSGTLGEFNAVLEKISPKTEIETVQSEQKSSHNKSIIEQCHRQEREIRRLQAENTLFRQVYQIERQQNQRSVTRFELCQMIDSISQQEEYCGCTSYLCKAAGISTSTFYKYRQSSRL